MIGIDPRHQRSALDPLIAAGFIEAADLGGGIYGYRIAPDWSVQDDRKTTARVPQDDGKNTARVPQEHRKTTARLPQEYGTGERESSNDAGLRHRSLYIDRDIDRDIEIEIDIPPTSPTGDDAKTSAPKAKRKTKAEPPEEWDYFWTHYPKRVGYGRAVEAYRKALGDQDPLLFSIDVAGGLKRWKESEQWAQGYVHDPATWLRGEMWRDDPPKALASGGPVVQNGEQAKPAEPIPHWSDKVNYLAYIERRLASGEIDVLTIEDMWFCTEQKRLTPAAAEYMAQRKEKIYDHWAIRPNWDDNEWTYDERKKTWILAS